MKANYFKISKIQLIRLISLLSVVAFFIFVPLSNKYANYKLAYNHPHLVELADGKISAFTYDLLDKFYTLWEDPIRAATSNNGSLWAYTIFGVPISDPLGLISELINSVKFPIKYFVGGSIPFLLAILFGRFFCAWLCPMVVVYGLTQKIRWVLDKLHMPLLNLRIDQSARIFLFWLGLIISYFMGAWVWHFILPYITFSHEIFSLIIFSSFTVGAYFLLAMILLDLAVIPGQFCKSICPTGLLLSWIGRVQVFKLKAAASKCPEGCHDCYDVCPVDLFPKNEKLHSCHLCAKCMDACPVQNIHFRLNEIYVIKQKE